MAVELTPNGTYGATIPRPPRWAMRGMMGISVGMFRLLGDRMRVQGRPLLLLTTVGARSGQTRHTILGWFPDGENARQVVASNAGAKRHPAWYYNLARNPDKVRIEVGGRKLQVRPESLTGAARAEAWQRVVALAPGYAKYERQTDREIPLVRLTPAE